MRAEKEGPPTGKDVNIQVVGHNDQDVAGLADTLAAELASEPMHAPHLTQLDAGRAAPARVMRLSIDSERAGELGLTQGQAYDRINAIRESVNLRLRPILLTTLTTSLGLPPMALGIPSYSVVWGSMAFTFMAGLVTATILTIFVVPVGWDLLMEWREKQRRATGSTSTAEHAG